jgi:single-stranded-DNA-specific exonuclease
MKDYRWEILSKKKPGSEGEIINILLANRGITSKAQKNNFFVPPDPLTIDLASVGISKHDLNLSINRLKEAIEKKEKIIVYGDYDSDGICATAILWETLHALGANVLPYIPDRVSEGYGLNEDSIAKLKKDDPNLKLIITVDHGIVGHKKIDFAHDLGVDVIVTDHHEPTGTKPNALAIIHTTQLSGAGVSWMLAREVQKISNFKFQISNLLELVAIGTVADLIPLTGPNRSLVKFGLEQLRKTQRPGLIALMRIARVDPLQIGTYEIGFIISPRLNAAGRLEHAIEALRLLCTKDTDRANDLAARLDQTNRERQLLTEETVLHAQQQVEDSKLIFISHQTYEQGIIGLVAGKFVDRYYRPTIIVSKGKDYSKGSARSIAGFNIIETIRQVEDLLVDVGGHPMAAGFTVQTSKLAHLEQRLKKIADSRLDDQLLSRGLKIDCVLDPSQISQNLAQKIAEFEPFGQGNPEPTFASYGLEISDSRTVGGENQHLKIKFQISNFKFQIDGIGFKMGDRFAELTKGSIVDIAYNISTDKWNNDTRLQLRLKDLKVHHHSSSASDRD